MPPSVTVIPGAAFFKGAVRLAAVLQIEAHISVLLLEIRRSWATVKQRALLLVSIELVAAALGLIFAIPLATIWSPRTSRLQLAHITFTISNLAVAIVSGLTIGYARSAVDFTFYRFVAGIRCMGYIAVVDFTTLGKKIVFNSSAVVCLGQT